MKRTKGVSGKKRITPYDDEKKEKRDECKLVRIEYVDHVLFKYTDGSKVRLSVRETVGWIYDDSDDSILIYHDQPLKQQNNEYMHPESGLILWKNSILGIWDINRQIIRSGMPS